MSSASWIESRELTTESQRAQRLHREKTKEKTTREKQTRTQRSPRTQREIKEQRGETEKDRKGSLRLRDRCLSRFLFFSLCSRLVSVSSICLSFFLFLSFSVLALCPL